MSNNNNNNNKQLSYLSYYSNLLHQKMSSPEKQQKWVRDPVDNFENMSLTQFHHYSAHHLEILRESKLGPTSNKDPTWGDSDTPPGPCIPLTIYGTCMLLLATGVGLAVGLTQDSVGWGIGAGVILLVVAFIAGFATLLTYLKCYGKGLQDPPMPTCVERGGFVRNIRANIVCRYFMTCFYNGHCDVWGCIMNDEAKTTLQKIESMNDGNGPEPGSVCWLGDSEFTFWHCLERDMSGFHTNHFNAGFGGARIVDLRRNVQRLCLDWDPSTVIVHASGNDYDYDNNLTAREIPARLLKLFETIASHESVKRIGYLLSSRRPIYADDKWDFMVRVHALTIKAIEESSLKGKIKVFDMRAKIHPLDHFVMDRVHLSDVGHADKSKVLLPKLLKVWPNPVSPDAGDATDESLDIIVE